MNRRSLFRSLLGLPVLALLPGAVKAPKAEAVPAVEQSVTSGYLQVWPYYSIGGTVTATAAPNTTTWQFVDMSASSKTVSHVYVGGTRT